jgi:beta-galactosidase
MKFPTAISQSLRAILALGLAAACAQARTVVSLDQDWRFGRGDAVGAQRAGYADSQWSRVDVPHDWSIAGPFDPANLTGGAGAFLPAGVGWYRRVLPVGQVGAGQRVLVEFDGVMANSDVWINGHHLGHRPYGYVGFAYEVTDFLRTDAAPNVLAVRVDDSAQPASRWYTGAGIVRHVRMVVTDPVHFERDGVVVRAEPAEGGGARLVVDAMVENQSATPRPVSLRVRFWDHRGLPVSPVGPPDSQTLPVAPEGRLRLSAGADASVIERWDLEHPVIYRAEVSLESSGRVLDTVNVPFGVRDARFEAATGFWLNGKNIKLKGVCVHGDGGAFGAAVPLDVWQRRLARLKSIGVNAIRTAHNPPDPGFLDLCDRMGLLVMDEMFDCWTVAKNPGDYHLYFEEWSKTDTRDTVRRDRNHPSIVLWSAGNEIHDTPNAEKSKRILAGLVTVFHEEDPTRPVTQALFRPNVSHDYDDGLAALLDVVGTNYRNAELLAAHAAHPTWKILGTEMGQTVDVWRFLRDEPAMAGHFLWVGIDYLGESPAWPYIGGGGDQSGLIDRTGLLRPTAYQRQSWWSDAPMVHLARRVARDQPLPKDPGYGVAPRRRLAALWDDWSPSSRGAHEETVEADSTADTVELFLNGKSLGVQRVAPRDVPCVWKVSFEAGTLRAVARRGDRIVAEDTLITAGPPAGIVLRSDDRTLLTGWDHVAAVEATVVDRTGVRVPDASNLITFRVDGPGRVAAVDNGDNQSHESFVGSERSAHFGRCVAWVKATAGAGEVRVIAEAPGLAEGSISLSVPKGD